MQAAQLSAQLADVGAEGMMGGVVCHVLRIYIKATRIARQKNTAFIFFRLLALEGNPVCAKLPSPLDGRGGGLSALKHCLNHSLFSPRSPTTPSPLGQPPANAGRHGRSRPGRPQSGFHACAVLIMTATSPIMNSESVICSR
jgi:hypothetical protein